jgi:NADPH:quinone reductase-like Zn-dependent oxidoreductase
MKVMVYTHYGPPDVLQFTEVEKPLPQDHEVLIKVQAASVNTADRYLLSGPLPVRLIGGGLRKPKDQRLGTDLAGQVEAVGRNVTQFQPGDEVFGGGSGAFADYACATETQIALKPANLSFEAAAAVPLAALTALQGLRDSGQIQPGQQVLIHGASGGVGTFAVQIAKAFGAEVTAVCSTRNVEQARSIGADQVIDYTKDDFTRAGQRFDLIVGVNGDRSLFAYRRALRPTGRYVMIGVSGGYIFPLLRTMLLGSVLSRKGGQHLGLMGITRVKHQDLVVMKELLEAGKVVPVIERRYPLRETAEAIRYLDEGHARGKVVITVDQSNS